MPATRRIVQINNMEPVIGDENIPPFDFQIPAPYTSTIKKSLVEKEKKKPHKKIALASRNFLGAFKTVYPNIHVFVPGEDNVRSFDLFIFPGGEDISPYLYRQENHYCYGVNEDRDSLEYNILNKAVSLNKKVFGVCRGLQLISVFAGMSLIQDIRIELQANHPSYHPLLWKNTGILYSHFSSTIVNSLHHQGVSIDNTYNINPACYYDKVLEGFETEKIIAVQWHPEFMLSGNQNQASLDFFKFLDEEW